MKKLFISYELAISLKSLGFTEPCLGSYTETYKELIINKNGGNL